MASLWLCQAAAGATVFVLTESLLPEWKWRNIDIAATLLNVSGSAIAGLAKGGAKADDTSDVRAALSIVMNGMLGVWTSLVFTMEHSAHLAVVKSLWAGLAYLVFSMLAGTVVYVMAFRLGRRWRVSRLAVDWAKRGPLWLVEGMESSAVLSAVAAATWGGWMAGQHAERLGWGVAMTLAGGVIGSWFSGLNDGSEGRLKWGDWRCNALAFAGVVTAGRYVASLDQEERGAVLESAFFTALIAQGFGTISGYSDLTADAGDLILEGDFAGAAENISLNAVMAVVALFARIKIEKTFMQDTHSD